MERVGWKFLRVHAASCLLAPSNAAHAASRFLVEDCRFAKPEKVPQFTVHGASNVSTPSLAEAISSSANGFHSLSAPVVNQHARGSKRRLDSSHDVRPANGSEPIPSTGLPTRAARRSPNVSADGSDTERPSQA